ncbi:MAG: alpha/beta hydrolase [Patescibacteria group bacterium]
MSKFSNAFVFHGTAGRPEDNWFPWLKTELEAQGVPTVVPRFPTPEGESLEAWFNVLDGLDVEINPDSLLIGHSKGGMFLLKVLERLEKPVKLAIFVAAPIGIKPILYYDADKQFSNFDFDWDKIRQGAEQFVVFHSDNDPYVSLGNGEKLADELGVELTLIPNAGHIHTSSGYTEFPEILDAIAL